MNINLKKAKKEFIKYTENYDLQNEHIRRKQEHSLRVMEISKQIAEGLNLLEEDIEIATLIGLLHDIARFDQYTQYKTFKDLKSFDHGDFGAEILRKDIARYIEYRDFDEIIIKAVENHNKFKIEEGLTPKQELFAKIVRDADKIDILYESVVMFWKDREQEVENSQISEEVIRQIKAYSPTMRKVEASPIDNIMRVIAFIFDLNFKESFQIIKREDYINRILDRYNFIDEYTKQKVDEIRKLANEYIEKGTK